MVLSDRDIRAAVERGRITIDPFDAEHVQPSSVDLRIDRDFLVFHNARRAFIDPREKMDDLTERITIGEGDRFILHPGEFALGSTLERVGLPSDLVARLEGKSSLGRLGLLIHSTAGYIDPGFEGHVTLELSNVANLPIAIDPGMLIGQISFQAMSSPAQNPYGSNHLRSKYQGQRGPTPSAYHRNVSDVPDNSE